MSRRKRKLRGDLVKFADLPLKPHRTDCGNCCASLVKNGMVRVLPYPNGAPRFGMSFYCHECGVENMLAYEG